MAKQKYTVVHPVEHDGVRVEDGGSLTLDESDAKPLLDVGAVVLATSTRQGNPDAAE